LFWLKVLASARGSVQAMAPPETDKEELASWFQEHQLERHAEKLTDANGDIGLASIADLLQFSDEEIDTMGERLSMNMTECKRFSQAVRGLRQPGPEEEAKAGQVVESTALAEVERDVETVDTFEVLNSLVFVMKAANNSGENRVGSLRGGTVIQVHRERVLGEDGHVWVELTGPEIRRSCDKPASRAFVLVDGSHLGLGRLLRGPLDREDTVPQRVEPVPSEPTLDAEELEAAMAAFAERPNNAELFEVAASCVPIYSTPDTKAVKVGSLRKGRLIHCLREAVLGAGGDTFAELTNLELWRSGEPEDMDDRGFVLVDGTRLGLGLQLQGPLPHESATWLAGRRIVKRERPEPAERAAPRKSGPPKVFAGLETYAELFEVKATVLWIKCDPLESSKTIGHLTQGQQIQVFRQSLRDLKGQEWLELTSYELWNACNPGDSDVRGFVLNKDAYLSGPKSDAEMCKWQDEETNKLCTFLAQKKAERDEREQEGEAIEQKIKAGALDGSSIYTYRALQSTVYMKFSEDPRHQWITTSACQPGLCFYSTGMEWRGPRGELWIDGCVVDGKHRWLLAEDPLAVGGPYLVQESFVPQHIYLRVRYFSVRNLEVFETFIEQNSTVKALKERLSREMNVNVSFLNLKIQAGTDSDPEELADRCTLLDLGISSSSELTCEYNEDVFQALMVGRACGWVAKYQ